MREKAQKQFLNFGYFITKPVKKPDAIKINSKTLLTASDCFCDIPNFLLISFGKDTLEIQEKFGLSEKQIQELVVESSELYKQEKMVLISFFLAFNDALNIKEKYFSDLLIYSLAIEKDFSETLIQEIEPYYRCKLETIKNDGVFCGYDILGTEGCGFHTYLCNGLDEVIENLKINEYGLIDNSYEEVCDFAKLIEGEGEPVIWLPFAVYKHD